MTTNPLICDVATDEKKHTGEKYQAEKNKENVST